MEEMVRLRTINKRNKNVLRAHLFAGVFFKICQVFSTFLILLTKNLFTFLNSANKTLNKILLSTQTYLTWFPIRWGMIFQKIYTPSESLVSRQRRVPKLVSQIYAPSWFSLLVDPCHWAEIEDMFLRDACALMGLSVESPLGLLINFPLKMLFLKFLSSEVNDI